MKKKNNIDDDDLFIIENFFTPDKPVATASQPQTNVSHPQGQVVNAPTVARIKSSEIPGVSIQKILNDEGKEKQVVATNKAEADLCTPFTQKDLNIAWNEYILTIPEKKILITTMESYKPILQEDFFIEIPVDNPIQEREILNERPSLVDFLRKKLRNYKIHLNTRIMQMEENKKMLSPKDRFKGILERNENIKRLCHDLNLELD